MTNRIRGSNPRITRQRSVRLRLAALVIALGVVILVMNEAGKTETWERLGFGDRAQLDQNENDLKSPESLAQISESDAANNPWLPALQSLSSVEVESLIGLLRSASSKDGPPTQDHSEILEKIRQQVDSNSEVGKHLLGLKEFSVNGNRDQLTAIDSDRILDAAIQRSFQFVEDQTSMNRSSERTAWNETWRSLQNSAVPEKPT